MLALGHLRLAELQLTVVTKLGGGHLGVEGRDIRRAVGRGPDVIPDFHVPVTGIGGGLGVQLTGEVQFDALLGRGQGDGHAGRDAGVADTLEATVLRGGGLPAA